MDRLQDSGYEDIAVEFQTRIYYNGGMRRWWTDGWGECCFDAQFDDWTPSSYTLRGCYGSPCTLSKHLQLDERNELALHHYPSWTDDATRRDECELVEAAQIFHDTITETWNDEYRESRQAHCFKALLEAFVDKVV